MARISRRVARPGALVHCWVRAIALVAVAGILAACGSDDAQRLNRVVVFGDSLSDMGTHQVGAVAQAGGGRYTVNPSPVWSERVARSLGYTMTVGMHGGFGTGLQVCPEPPNCTNWAVGGARVTLHPGIAEDPGGHAQLATTIKEQIDLHLARFDGKFDNNDLVLAQAGGNDLFHQLGVLLSMLQQGATLEQASAAAVAAMATAGAEFASYVKNDILGKGAQYVIVATLVDVGITPFGVSLGPDVQALMATMGGAFNAQLLAGLAGTEARIVDFKALLDQWVGNPAAYGISNASAVACSQEKIAAATGGLVQDGSSLFCTTQTLIDADTGRYLFASDVHPAPYGHELIANAYLAEIDRNHWR